MAPKTKPINTNPEWYKAYYDPSQYKVIYEWELDGHLISAGDLIRVKNMRETYKFRCVIHQYSTGKEWFECILSPHSQSNLGGSWHSFTLDRLKRHIVPKRRRRTSAK